MSDRFLITENTHRVAVQLADRWATATEAQARRILSPENLRLTVLDQWLQVVALHHVVAAARTARKHAPAAATGTGGTDRHAAVAQVLWQRRLLPAQVCDRLALDRVRGN